MNVHLQGTERDQYYKDFKQAGVLAKEVLHYGARLIKPGASYAQIMRDIYAKIDSLGAKPAFPPQMSFNEVAAHYMVGPTEDVEFSDQLVKLDVGVSVNGAIGDNALTVDLSGKYGDLVKASRDAVESAVDMMEIDVPIRDIGKEIEAVISSHGEFTSVKNLSGHGLNPHVIHCKPTIPNFDNQDPTLLSENMTFACEPFATTGKGAIHDVGNGWIFRHLERKAVRDPIARRLQDDFEQFKGLPFSLFEVDISGIPLFKLRVALKSLERAGALESYGALVEDAKGMVTQAEHSVLFDEDGKKFVTTR